jgi:DNA-binding LacI/PurR family transcriptional regulator
MRHRELRLKKPAKRRSAPRSAPPQPASRMTMADLAQIAGVSKITISRALGDGDLVNVQTRERIRALAEQHGYTLNITARNLRLRRSQTVAVVVEMKPSASRPLSGPYPLEILGGISQELTSVGYSVLLTTRQAPVTPALQAADGVILLGQGAHDDAVHLLDRWRLPMVVWGARRAGDRHIVVGSDNREGGALAADRFLAIGRRRAVFLGDLDHMEIAERYAGFRDTFARHGLKTEVVRREAFTMAAGAEATQMLLARGKGARIDAIFACNDLLAMGAIRALLEHGARVPDDISVIGYDDTPLGASFIPPLSSIHQSWHDGGVLLARKLLQQIDGKRPRSETLPTSLIVRST